jgi:uncharacterized protein
MSDATKPRRDRIRRLILKLSERCNLNCSYCYMYNHADQGYLERPLFMSEDIFERILDRVLEYCSSRPGHGMALHFHGGEPMLMKAEKFDRMARYARDRLGVKLTGLFMQTNATLVNEAWIAVLKKTK